MENNVQGEADSFRTVHKLTLIFLTSQKQALKWSNWDQYLSRLNLKFRAQGCIPPLHVL